MYPVLIGSYALVKHNIIESYHDIDLIANNEIGGSLALKSDEKNISCYSLVKQKLIYI